MNLRNDFPLYLWPLIKVAERDVNLFFLLINSNDKYTCIQCTIVRDNKIKYGVGWGRNRDRLTAMQTKARAYLRIIGNKQIYFGFFLIYKFIRSKYSPLVNTSDDNIILNPLICIILYSTISRFAAVWSNMSVVLWILIT